MTKLIKYIITSSIQILFTKKELTNTTTGMRWTTVAEGIKISFDLFQIWRKKIQFINLHIPNMYPQKSINETDIYFQFLKLDKAF